MVASIVGSVLAPIIKNNIGLYACFGLKVIVSLLSLIYGIFCVKEPTKDIQDPIRCEIEKILFAFHSTLRLILIKFQIPSTKPT